MESFKSRGNSDSSTLAQEHCHENIPEKTKKRKSSSSTTVQQQQSAYANAKKARPWATYNKNPSKEEVNRALIKTANSISEQLKRGNEQNSAGPKEVDDEDSLFLRSLIPSFKRLSGSQKAFLRIQTENLLYEAEFSQQQIAGCGYQPVHMAGKYEIKQQFFLIETFLLIFRTILSQNYKQCVNYQATTTRIKEKKSKNLLAICSLQQDISE